MARTAYAPKSAAVIAALLIAPLASGAAFIEANTAGGTWGAGFGNPAGDFVRWSQANINYNFTQAFVNTYGAIGVAAVNAAFTSWNAAVAAAALPGIDISAPMVAGDVAIPSGGENYDLQSVALHEIGHILGLDHLDLAGAANNYNVAAGAWAAGAIPAGSHPVMWSTIGEDLRRRALTDDDLYAVQHLYTAGAGGAGTGAIAGPTFGGGTPFTFAQAAGPAPVHLTIHVTNYNDGTLAAALASGPASPMGQPWQQLTSGTILFNIPAPGPAVIFAMAGFVAIKRRR